MTILLAVLAGAALGYVFARGDFCFHSTLRNVFARSRDRSLLRAYLLLLLLATPFVQLLRATDVIDPFIAPLSWGAAVVGGSAFGVGMVIASTCVSGMFYKLGQGMVGMAAAIASWAIGDLLVYRGPLNDLQARLNNNPVTFDDEQGAAQTETFTTLAGPFGVLLLVLFGGAIVWYLLRTHKSEPATEQRGRLWGWGPLGAAAAIVMVIAWLLTRWHGVDYTYGTSGVPSSISRAVFDGEGISWWIPLGLFSLIPGAFVAARLSGTTWLRGETSARLAQLGAGGLIMGIGAGIAGGCNLGHSMVGVPLLSLGSIVTTLSIIMGVLVADRAVRLIGSV